MNDLKESNETIKQTTDELKRQQEELKNILDILNKEKNDWAKKSDIENLDEKIRNLQNLLVREILLFFFLKINFTNIYFQSSLRDRLNDVSRDDNNIISMPDLSGFVTWDRLEDALRGIRESIEKTSNDAAAALASARDARQPVQVIERQSQTVSKLLIYIKY